MNNSQASTSPIPAARPRRCRLAASGLAACLLVGTWLQPASANVVTEWNALALGCIPRGGPATALDVALMQAAVHDAVQAIEKR